ncbi:alkene reductase [Candidatus Nitrospira allomarina]|uniref:Alkene reductase n=1 Tax=Candidatus Nitrospira allomarina TaxID=3020900 RepID=A0AA96GC80_9BACT|nr:alkene reductase [Candidatus Nitrospira allomarina]WNM58911.1 alkene reductase [Candidatus Nitrospira allomarina]
MTKLFEPLHIGSLTLPNRIIMAPLTRMRSQQPGNVPHELNAEYYAQRASSGLIVSEATQISQQGQGYPGTPGIHSPEQVQGWKLVTDAVHKAGGRIFLQLWHVGRISHPSHQPDGGLPVAPSALAAENSGTYTVDWQETPILVPRALETDEIPGIVGDYNAGAQNAKSAGFDGVEVHGANGYLLDQFLQDGSNLRTDHYGGSIENRARLLLEVVDSVIEVWGKDRVGVRLSPFNAFNGMKDSDPIKLFTYVLGALDTRGVAYVHLIEPRSSFAGMQDESLEDKPQTSSLFRPVLKTILISAGGHTPVSASEYVENNLADAVAFGRHFISNPDLPERIRQSSPLTPYDRATFYGGDMKGYTDYLPLKEQAA